MKNLLFIALCSAGSMLYVQAEQIVGNEFGNYFDKLQTYGERGPTGKPFKVGVEIGNGNPKNPIWVKVFNGPNVSAVYQVAQASPGFLKTGKTRANFSTNIAEPTSVMIWNANPETTQQLRNPNAWFSFPTNKTAYVTWDPSSKTPLRPAGSSAKSGVGGLIGKVVGGFGATESNLSLKNNVSQKDIYLVPTKDYASKLKQYSDEDIARK